MKAKAVNRRLVDRQNAYDEMVRKHGKGPATKGMMVTMPNGRTSCYIRPGSNSK